MTVIVPSALTELELPRFVRDLPGWPWADAPVTVQRISSGLTNVNWRMTDAGGTDYFLKVPGLGTRAFIDRAVANAAATTAAELGVGPEVLYYDDASGVEVSRFLDGYRSATVIDFANAETGMRLMQLYRRLHDGPLLPVTKTIFDMIDEHLAQLADGAPALRPWQQAVLDRWAPLHEAYLVGGIDLVPGHNDMLPSNYMLGKDDELMLIDYDYAANTDRAYELGGILTLYPLSDEVREAMVRGYFGDEVDDRDRARLRASGIATCVKWGLWGLVNAAARPTEDFDFIRYGCMHLMNASLLLDDTDLAALDRELRRPPAPRSSVPHQT